MILLFSSLISFRTYSLSPLVLSVNVTGRFGVLFGYDPEALVASGGAGKVQHFIDVFEQADVDAALAATVFHSGQIPIPELKLSLAEAGIEVRPC